MDQFMARALDLANEAVKEGGQPFGAVLVKDGKIVSEGVNELHIKYDISGHAELLAIRRAQEELQTLDLSGYTMYASGEPCPMCMTAIYFSGIEQVYFCESVEDAKEAGLDKSVYVYSQLALPREQRAIEIKHMSRENDVLSPLEQWQRKESRQAEKE